MSKTRNRHRLLTMLVRAGWKPRRNAWTVPCRDCDSHRTYAQVSIAEHGPQLTIDGSSVAVFDPLAAGRLRAALKEAIELYARLDGAAREGVPAPRSHPGAAPTPHGEHPAGSHVEAAAGRVRVDFGDDGDGELSGRHALRSAAVVSEAA
ncbi:hypothetical protein [Amycolatopsis marina]|uniref:hypothetical protein n=1 Tax=Amycolatopsis marina TaxID=490629 RepID=UPI001160CE7D|nr:hypothetical protein [Amycolatopsis marina]